MVFMSPPQFLKTRHLRGRRRPFASRTREDVVEGTIIVATTADAVYNIRFECKLVTGFQV